MDDPTLRVSVLKDDYLADIEAEMAKEAEGPKPKTKKQKRAERKERKRLQAIEDKKLILRDSLERELKLSKLNQATHLKEWEEMCSELKILELRQEMIQWGEEAKRNLDRKNYKIEMLLEDMDETMAQQKKMHSKSIELIDYINSCYNELLNSTKRIYEWQAGDLLHDYYKEIKRRTEEVDFLHNHTDNIMHASNILGIRTLREGYEVYLHKRDDAVNTNIEERFLIRDKVVEKMKLMHRQLSDFVDALTNTELDAHKYERIRQLTERQIAFIDESNKLNHEEMTCTSHISQMKREMYDFQHAKDIEINDLRLELAYFQNVRAKLEYEAAMDRDLTRQKLRVLTTECYSLIKMLEKHAKSGELLISLSANCRKMQTKQEKIVLGGEIPDEVKLENFDENFKLKVLNLFQHLDISEEQIVEQSKFLRNFWRRQAMVEAQNLLLLEEKRKLTAENEKYINFIKSMNPTSHTDELMDFLHVKSVEQPMPAKLPCLSHKFIKSEEFH